MCIRPDIVRQKFPLETTYSRHVLPHVVGFPHLEVLRLIRHPIADAFPVRVLRIRSCKKTRSQDNVWGFPSSCMRLFVHATVYGELRQSFTSSHSRVASTIIRALITDALVLVSVRVKALTDRDSYFGAISTFGESRPPLRPARFSVYASSILFAGTKNPTDSAIDATLDTGGWLDLTRQGLAPCKTHQASPGALTPQMRGFKPAPMERKKLAEPQPLKQGHILK
jgi:hypothetical protein